MVSIVFIGILCGNMFGSLADKYGRRSTVLASYALIFLFGISSAILSFGFWSLLFWRFCVGVAVGIGLPVWVALGKAK
jgi:MFS family permease